MIDVIAENVIFKVKVQEYNEIPYVYIYATKVLDNEKEYIIYSDDGKIFKLDKDKYYICIML